MSQETKKQVVVAELVSDYQFRITFDDAPGTTLLMDEPAPLGKLAGPNASRVLAAAVANCLSASLLFCLRKSKIDVRGIRARAQPSIDRSEDGYWRVSRIDVQMELALLPGGDEAKVSRCLSIFENYCIVTGAVRKGIQVDVRVERKS